MKQANSPTTTTRTTTALQTGTPPGETGCGDRWNSGAGPVEVARRLARHRPHEISTLLRSQALSRKIEFVRETNSARPGLGARGTPEQVAELRAIAEKALTPAPASEIAEWMAITYSVTVSAKTNEFTYRLQLQTLTDRLGAYPADIVKAAVLGWDGKYFPSWAELKDRMANDFRERMELVNALRRPLDDRQAQRQREGHRPSAEAARQIVNKAGLGMRAGAGRAQEPMAIRGEKPHEASGPARWVHWTEREEPGSPALMALEAERDANPIIRAARAEAQAQNGSRDVA